MINNTHIKQVVRQYKNLWHQFIDFCEIDRYLKKHFSKLTHKNR